MKDNKNAQEIAKSAATTGLIGTAIGGTIGSAIPLAVPVAKAGARQVNKTAQTVKQTSNDLITNKPFRNVSDDELRGIISVRDAQRGSKSNYDVSEADTAALRAVQQKLGLNQNDASALDQVIDARRGYDVKQANKAPLLQPLNQGGYAKIPGRPSRGVLGDAQAKAKAMLDEPTDPLESLKTLAKNYKSADEFIAGVRGSATQYGEYNPSLRLAGNYPDAKRLSDLGVDPNREVTIYRGIDDPEGKVKRQINDGDFVTADYDSALAYTGSPKDVVSMKVKAKDLFSEDAGEFQEHGFYTGAEFVYSSKQGAKPQLPDDELKAIYNEATQAPKKSIAQKFGLTPLNEGGYAKNPFAKKEAADVTKGLNKDQSEFINDYANMLEDMDKGNGVTNVMKGDEYSRQTTNSPFYRETYAETGRPPTKEQWLAHARNEIESGRAAFGASDDYKSIPAGTQQASRQAQQPVPAQSQKSVGSLADNNTNYFAKPPANANVVMMTPDEYIQKAFGNRPNYKPEANAEAIKRATEYAEAMKRGDKFPVPSLSDNAQDGFHRVFAAKLNGAKQIPVEMRTNTGNGQATPPTAQLSNKAVSAKAENQSEAASLPDSTPADTFIGKKALWRNGDTDQPIKVTGYAGEVKGRHYVNIAGTKTAIPLDEVVQSIKVKQPNNGSNIPVNKLTQDGDRITATNVNPNIKRGEKRFALDDTGKMIPDTKGAYRLFTGDDGKVESFRVGNKVYKASELGDLSDVNDFNKVLLSQRRNTERQYGKETAEKVNDFTVDFQQAQATQMINRQVEERDGLQALADDLGINFGVGRRNAKKVSAAIQDFGEGVKDKPTIIKEFGPAMAAKIVKADKYFRARYDKLLDEANEKLTEFGYDPIPKRKDYYTHFDEPGFWEKVGLGMQDIKNLASPTLQDATGSAGRSSISNKLAGQSEYMTPNKAFNKFALRREGNKRTADAFGAFERYLSPTLNNIYMTEAITRARVLSKVIAQNADIDGKKIDKTIIGLREYANNLAGKSNRIGDRYLADTMYGPKVLQALQFVQRRAGGNSIVGNLATAALQPVVLSQTVGKFGAKNFLLGAMQEVSTAHAKTAPIRQSEFMRRRYANLNAVTRTKTERAGNVANTPLKVVEQTAARVTWNAAYNNALSDGLKGKAAIQRADVDTEKTISGRSIGEKPEAFNSKTLGLTTMYQLEVNNYWQQVSKEMTKTQVAKTLAAAYIFNLGLQAVTGREVGFNPIDAAIDSYEETKKEGKTKTEKAKAIVQRNVGEVVDNTPFIGQALNIGIGDKNLRKYLGPTSNAGRFGVSSPISALASTMKVGGISVPQNLILPFGGSQLKKTTEGAQILLAGKKTDKDGKTVVDVEQTPVNIARGLLFGPNAIKEVNAYNSNMGLSKADQKAVPNQIKSVAGTQGLEGLSQEEQEIVNSLPKKDQEAVIRDFKGLNKGANLQAIEDKRNGVTSTTSTGTKTGVKAIDDLTQEKKNDSARLKASLSPADYRLSNMSKADRQKLIDNGTYTQAKFTGLDKYVNGKRKELGMTVKSDLTGVNEFADSRTKKVLGEYNSLDAKQRDAKAYKEYDYDYKVAKAKYENDKANGKLSRAQAITAEQKVLKLKAGSGFSKEARELYGLSKDDFFNLISNDPNGNAIAEQALAYGDKLVAEGIDAKNKFRNSKGGVAFGTSSSSGGSRRTGRGSRGGRTNKGANGTERSLSQLLADFKAGNPDLLQSRTKGASLARNAKLARKTA